MDEKELEAKPRAVLAVIGLKATGKDVFAEIAIAHGFKQRRVSDAVRQAALDQEGLVKPAFEDLNRIGNAGRHDSGDLGYWVKKLYQMARADGDRLVIVNGIRHPGELEALAECAKEDGALFCTVGITAPTAVRALRLMKRARPGDPTTFEAFLDLDDADRGIGHPWDGQQVDAALARVPWSNRYHNNGTLEDYQAWSAGFVVGFAASVPVA
jgi:predicted kinase